MTAALAILTMGQSPRPDRLGNDVQAIAGNQVRIVERGALDGLSREEIAELSPHGNEYHIITLLADRSSVQLSKQAMLQRIQTQITDLERDEEIVGTALMCTGEFPEFRHTRPLLRPQAALYGAVIGMANGERIGSLTPLESQLGQARRKWMQMGIDDVLLFDANPYLPTSLQSVHQRAREAREAGARLLFMDCFGYDLAMRAAARDAFQGPVVLARSLAARIALELVA